MPKYDSFGGGWQLPGLTILESTIARAWLAKHSTEYEDIQFQVRMGSQADIGPQYGEQMRAKAALDSQKRADIVARTADAVTIIEVKPRITLSALGQLLGYGILWQAEHPTPRQVFLIAIGQTVLLDAADVLQAHGVHVELFP